MDLRVSDDELLARMKSKWRYNIRKAYRSGVLVREGTVEDLETFQDLIEETGRRQGFNSHSLAYHQTAFETLGETCMKLFLADVNEEPVAAITVAQVGVGAWYPWGASSERHRKAMPNFALQHEAMLWAKKQGAMYYDLWGIPEPLGKLALQERIYGPSREWPTFLPVSLERLPPHDLWTVFRMKQGFGGQIVHLVGAWDLPVQPVAFRIYTAAAKVQNDLNQLQDLLPSQVPTQNSLQERNGKHSVNLEWDSELDSKRWDSALGILENPHFMQSWPWGIQMARQGWIPLRKRSSRGTGKVSGMAQVFLKDLYPTKHLKLAYVPGGPNLTWRDVDSSLLLLKQLEEELRQQNVVLLRIAPNLCRDRATGLGAVSRLEESGWHLSRFPWMEQEREISNLTDSSVLAHSPDERSSPESGSSEADNRGIVRQGDLSDFERLSELTKPERGDYCFTTVLGFGKDIWTATDETEQPRGNTPRSKLVIAEERGKKLVGAALLVAWADFAWFFPISCGERAPPDWAFRGMRHRAFIWAKAQGCTSLDWGPTPFYNSGDPYSKYRTGKGIHLRRPQIGTWSRILWPLPTRVATHVLHALEKMLTPTASISEHLHV